MPSYAYLKEELHCPFCDVVVNDLLGFQWGYCPGRGPKKEYIYQLGDPIYWQKCKDGSIPAWTYFDDGVRCNIGDPAIQNLIVRDSTHYWQRPIPCPECEKFLFGAAVEIIQGIIKRAWIYEHDQYGDKTDYLIYQTDGTLVPKPEWYDRSMVTIRGCLD